MRYRIEDTFDCTTRRFWEVFFDEAYNAALYRHLDIGRRIVRLDRDESSEQRHVVREQVLTPTRELPAFMAKFIKGALAYREKAVLHGDVMQVENIPSVLADKLESTGTFRLETIAPDKINRIWEGELSCSIPLVGKKIEERIVAEVREDYRKATAFTRTWLADQPS